MMISGIKRALEIRQNKLYSKQTDLVLQIISTFNPNNTLVFNTTEGSFNIPKRNNISGFQNIKLINSKWKPPKLKKLLIEAEFCNEEAVVRDVKTRDSLLLSKEYLIF